MVVMAAGSRMDNNFHFFLQSDHRSIPMNFSQVCGDLFELFFPP